jgi:hypothetical protein
MRRRRFTILSALSLLLSVAMAVLWVRSQWVDDFLLFDSRLGGMNAVSKEGRLGFEITHVGKPPAYGLARNAWRALSLERLSPSMSLLINRKQPRVGPNAVYIPHWFAVGLSLILPFRWFRRWRRDRWAERKGLCGHCGYDLRVSKERCPECGTAIPAPPAATSGKA